VACHHCGGNGQRLAPDVVVCPQCRWLRPLAPEYGIECTAFQWAEDGKAMATLRSIGPLNAAARAISDKVGRRWIEATFNGIRLSEKQFPAVYAQAVKAARILGMPYLPDVYISGERMWDAVTYGSDQNAFVVLGTALITNFQGDELLFLLAREMGHCRAGHALWKTVIRFLLGEQGPRKGIMANGLLSALNPSNLIGGALELPLLGWARQAEITADRAGLLAVGSEEVARRVLLSWALKSSMLCRQVNLAAWLEQQAESDDEMLQLSEMMSSSTPYITRRLKLLAQFAQSPELGRWRTVIGRYSQSAFPPSVAPQVAPVSPTVSPGAVAGLNGSAANHSQPSAPAAPKDEESLRLVCSACRTGMRIPRAALNGREILKALCPNANCGQAVILKKKPAPATPLVAPALAVADIASSDD
jgi:Zn-dependent protease with chaperone function